MTIHTDHPFAMPSGDRDPLRRLRARLGGAVTLWTAGVGDGAREKAGLTVTSLMVGGGEPGVVVALLDDQSDLYEMLVRSGTAVVSWLRPADRDLAEAFAGLAPAPGGLFRLGEWEATTWGPRLTTSPTWAGVRLHGEPVEAGWSMLVTATVEHVQVADTGGADDALLTHLRGEYGEG